MKKDTKQVYQFKISLLWVRPIIWRRIQVPSHYTILDLHNAIQRAMGWDNFHLHKFIMGIDDDSISDNDKMQNIFSLENNRAYYEYDFGDRWEHEVLLEKILSAVQSVQYPICLAGKRACPPEDCGGTPGYSNLLRIMKNPRDIEYRDMIEWLGEKFYPEKFNPKDVCFDNEYE
jgi:hypothetical protein